MTNEHTADTHASPVDVVTKLIESRRSIKPADFSGRRVEDALVWQMLRNANWAPTHGMTEPWRFFVYTDAARIRLGKFLAEIYQTVTPEESFKPAKAAKLISNAERSSHLIVIAMKRQVSEKIPEVEEIEAVACAVQNLHLTATAMGVAGYWSSGKAICSVQLCRHLGLSPGDCILGLFYVGYPGTDWPSGSRSPVGEKVVWASDA
ncbi:MAG: nitroreductase [Fuerstiella sp.]|nr:nitroreductase [Fuerstiella sp.]